jgi:hypothetical protein
MAKKTQKKSTEIKKMLRTHKHFFSLNDKENKALERYVAKYKVKNKSRFIRETLMFAILKKFDEDHPTLFD